MKPFASYSRRFKLNFKPKQNRFSEKFTLVLPLNKNCTNGKLAKGKLYVGVLLRNI